MALVIRGKTKCRLCGRVHGPDDDIEMFPSGLFGRSDPAFEVNDAGVHHECLLAQSYAQHALEVRDEYLRKWAEADDDT